MKLTELEPRWIINGQVFVFRCPHCRQTWLSCKNVVMSTHDQVELFQKAGLDPCGPRYAVVPMKAEVCWRLKGNDFASLTVEPSIDASSSGHWHGHINAGAIVGGEIAK